MECLEILHETRRRADWLFAEHRFYFLSAGCAFLVFEKLRLVASGILTPDQQAPAAFFTFFIDKGDASAKGACYVQRPAASRTGGVSDVYFPQAGGAGVAKGTAASAFVAYPRVAVDELTAVDALLLIKSHTILHSAAKRQHK